MYVRVVLFCYWQNKYPHINILLFGTSFAVSSPHMLLPYLAIWELVDYQVSISSSSNSNNSNNNNNNRDGFPHSKCCALALGHPTIGPACPESLERAFAWREERAAWYLNCWAPLTHGKGPGDAFHGGINQESRWYHGDVAKNLMSGSLRPKTIANFMAKNDAKPSNWAIWRCRIFRQTQLWSAWGFQPSTVRDVWREYSHPEMEVPQNRWFIVEISIKMGQPGISREISKKGDGFLSIVSRKHHWNSPVTLWLSPCLELRTSMGRSKLIIQVKVKLATIITCPGDQRSEDFSAEQGDRLEKLDSFDEIDSIR